MDAEFLHELVIGPPIGGDDVTTDTPQRRAWYERRARFLAEDVLSMCDDAVLAYNDQKLQDMAVLYLWFGTELVTFHLLDEHVHLFTERGVVFVSGGDRRARWDNAGKRETIARLVRCYRQRTNHAVTDVEDRAGNVVQQPALPSLRRNAREAS
ncbi:hypothetical protein [Nocardia sp. NPDC052566]|uniref:hypothetical protein n=1 Tax=Nocardia sp. NPDC052566 TaxID=3364330 RepID=UPI0037C84254